MDHSKVEPSSLPSTTVDVALDATRTSATHPPNQSSESTAATSITNGKSLITSPSEETASEGDDASAETASGDWSNASDGASSRGEQRPRYTRPPAASVLLSSARRPILSQADIEICMELDQQFDHTLQEQDISYTARFNSVRQSACFSVMFMLIYLTLGTVFFVQQAEWSVADSLLFSIYTVTTVGYGHLEHPQTAGFQLYVIFYIFIGIACLTIMVAQVYQCIALEATRAQHAQDIRDMSRQQGAFLSREQVPRPAASPTTDLSAPEIIMGQRASWSDQLLRWFFRIRLFFRDNEYGKAVSVLFPFLGLILAGSMVVGPIEGWSMVESLYFAVVSLTTVGFGDYYPTRTASIWFCVLWLPFSIGFMSFFLASVAGFYIRLSDANVERLELQLRRRLERIMERQEKERKEARRRALRGQELADGASEGDSKDLAVEIGTVEIETGQNHRRRKRPSRQGFDKVPMDDDRGFADTASQDSFSSESSRRDRRLFGSIQSIIRNRRDTILHNKRRSVNASLRDQTLVESGSQLQATTMSTMRDVIVAIRWNIDKENTEGISLRSANEPESEFLSVRSRKTLHRSLDDRTSVLRPSFALRVLVQERLSEIVALEIAGYSNSIEIHDNSMTVTIDVLRATADKWLLPRRARKAFRAVCFDAILFVGEHGLITRGADALFDLAPFEFHSLFAPLLAAMGDAETMAGWLTSTQVLADADLHRGRASDPSCLTVVGQAETDEEIQHDLQLHVDQAA